MGTNYYADFITERRDIYGKTYHTRDEAHIGKSSAGWRFSWQGYEEHPDFGTITTVTAWRELLKKAERIYDEYNRPIGLDAFLVEALDTRGKAHAHLYPDGNWMDGMYSFSGGEFS